MKEEKWVLVFVAMGIILSSFAIGGIMLANSIEPADLTPKDATIELEQKQKTALDTVITSEIHIGELACKGEICTASLTAEGLNTSVSIPWKYCSDTNSETLECLEESYYTNEELKAKRDAAIKARLELIANATIQRQEQTETTKQLGEGTITTTTKK